MTTRPHSDVGNLVFGGNVFGWTASQDTSFSLLDSFLEQGGKMVDTADSYSHWVEGNSGGESETIIGKWLASRGARSRVQVATKVSQHPEFTGLSPLNVMRACDASLTRLGTDVIDLYWAHFDDESTPIVETAAAFSELKRAGKIRHIGLSNYSAERIDEWIHAARTENLELPTALQPHYNLMERGIESNGIAEAAQTHNLAILPYFSLAKGFLTGKYRSSNDAYALGASPRAGGALEYLDERGRRVLALLDEIAGRHETTVAAVALSWLRAQPGVAAPIASARNTSQLAGILASMHLTLDAEEVDALTEASSLR